MKRFFLPVDAYSNAWFTQLAYVSKRCRLILILFVKNLSIFIQYVGRLFFAFYLIQQVIYSVSNWSVWSALSGRNSLNKLRQILEERLYRDWLNIYFSLGMVHRSRCSVLRMISLILLALAIFEPSFTEGKWDNLQNANGWNI